MNIYALVTIIFCIFYPTNTIAWWDKMHLMIGKVAESHLSKSSVEKVNAYLSVWEDHYPKMSDMVSVCVWPDHFRCLTESYECTGLPFQDHFDIFNYSHTVGIPYNPFGLDEEMLTKPRQGSQDGIRFLLNSVKAHVQSMKRNPCTSSSCKVQIGSDVSWNLYLRLFLHMYGDVHVPCHCCYGVSQYFPKGDFIGLNIPLESPTVPRTEFQNLHVYIDTLGFKNFDMWPFITNEEIEDWASKYTAKYPYDSFNTSFTSVDPWDFDTIVQESYDLQVQIYKLVNFEDFNPKKGKMVIPENVQKEIIDLLEARMVLAGYRLGRAMVEYASALPDTNANIFSKLNTKAQKHDNEL